MTAKYCRRYSKRVLSEIEEGFDGIPYNLRKKLNASVVLSGNERPKITQTNATKDEASSASNSIWRSPSYRVSLEFPSHSQDDLRRIYSQGKGKKFNLDTDSEETESSDEEEGISVEELKKTEGWKSFVKNVDSKHVRESKARILPRKH